MAKQAVVNRPETVAVPIPAPGKTGRGKTPKAENAAVSGGFDYSRFKLTFRSPETFASFLAGYPDKSGILAYVYRLRPRIDFSLIGIAESSILKTSNPTEMTEDYIASVFGRGDYQLKLTDANRAKGEQEVAKTFFSVNDADLPCIYDPRTLLLGEPKNQDEVARLLQQGVLIRDSGNGAPRLRTENDGSGGMAPVSQSAPVGGGGGGGDVFGKEVISKMLLKLVDSGSQTPASILQQSIEISKMLNPAPVVSTDELAERVAAKLKASGGDVSMLENYERVGKLLDRIRPEPAASAAAAPAPGAPWFSFVPGILGELRGLVGDVVSQLAVLQSSRVEQPQQAGPQRAAPQPIRKEQPQPMSIIERIKQVAAMALTEVDKGTNGTDFAVYVCQFIEGGPEVYDMLASHGTAGLMSLLAMQPDTAALVQDSAKRAKIQKFLDEFFAGVEDDSAPGAVAVAG
jgi:hypothetical protein